MKVKVTEKQVMITEAGQVNAGEYGVNLCEFILPESFEGLCVTAMFNGIPTPLVDSQCYIPSLESGTCVLGVYAYRQNLGETELMYSPNPDEFKVGRGSFTENINEEHIPKGSEFDLHLQMLKEKWAELIKSNTVPQYTENATENQYYSANALNEMYRSLQGDLERVSALVGGAE